MEMLYNFYDSFGFLIAFLILVNIFYMLLGASFTESFLLLVLLGMVILNADKFATIFKGVNE